MAKVSMGLARVNMVMTEAGMDLEEVSIRKEVSMAKVDMGMAEMGYDYGGGECGYGEGG